MSSISIGQRFDNCVDYLKNGYKNSVKPKFQDGIKYTKDLKNDVVDFVKKNPKKTGSMAAGALLAVSLTAFVAKLLQDNQKMHAISAVKTEHIGHQREIIDALKDDIADRQEIIDTQHDMIFAQRGKINSLKDDLSQQTGE